MSQQSQFVKPVHLHSECVLSISVYIRNRNIFRRVAGGRGGLHPPPLFAQQTFLFTYKKNEVSWSWPPYLLGEVKVRKLTLKLKL